MASALWMEGSYLVRCISSAWGTPQCTRCIHRSHGLRYTRVPLPDKLEIQTRPAPDVCLYDVSLCGGPSSRCSSDVSDPWGHEYFKRRVQGIQELHQSAFLPKCTAGTCHSSYGRVWSTDADKKTLAVNVWRILQNSINLCMLLWYSSSSPCSSVCCKRLLVLLASILQSSSASPGNVSSPSSASTTSPTPPSSSIRPRIFLLCGWPSSLHQTSHLLVVSSMWPQVGVNPMKHHPTDAHLPTREVSECTPRTWGGMSLHWRGWEGASLLLFCHNQDTALQYTRTGQPLRLVDAACLQPFLIGTMLDGSILGFKMLKECWSGISRDALC